MAVKICGRKKCGKLFVPYYANKFCNRYGTRVQPEKGRGLQKEYLNYCPRCDENHSETQVVKTRNYAIIQLKEYTRVKYICWTLQEETDFTGLLEVERRLRNDNPRSS